MTTTTKTLTQFIVSITLITVVFRITLSSFLNSELYNYVFIPPAIYFISMFLTGRYFGKKDYKFLPKGDIGFRFHLSTFVVFFLVSYTINYLGYMSQWEPRRILDITLMIWGIFLLVHFIFYLNAQKTTIKGLDKNDLFE